MEPPPFVFVPFGNPDCSALSVARLERETGGRLRPRRTCPYTRNSPSVTALHLHKRHCSRHGLVPFLKVVSTKDNSASLMIQAVLSAVLHWRRHKRPPCFTIHKSGKTVLTFSFDV